MASDLDKKIVRQIEYYFGDINLPRDKFLQEKIKENEGWVTLEVLLTFKRLANLSSDAEVIAKAVENSESNLVEVSEDHKKIRRNPDQILPELTEERRKELMKRSAYAKGFPLDETLNEIVTFLEPYGPIEACIRRTAKDHKFKGSCFIIFKEIDLCKKFVEEESIKYKDTELIRKWQNDYFTDKKKEIEERKKSKKEKKTQNAEKPEKQPEYPKGAVVQFTGIPEGQSLTREEIKEKFTEVGEIEPAFIDFNKGDLEGYVRFPAENDAHEFMKKVADGEIELGEVKLKVKVIEGEEEEEYIKKTIETVSKIRQRHKFNSRNNRKRKGNFGGNDRNAKAKKQE